MKKRLLLSVLILSLAITASIVVGSFAVMYDNVDTSQQGSSNKNVYNASSLWLQVNNQPTLPGFTFPNVAVGTGTMSYVWKLENMGTIPGNSRLRITNLTELENSLVPQEVALGDTGPIGELGGQLDVVLWADFNSSGAQDPGEVLFPLAGTDTLANLAIWLDPAITSGIGPGRVALGVLTPGIPLDVHLDTTLHNYGFGLGNLNNLAQSDSVLFDIGFTLSQ